MRFGDKIQDFRRTIRLALAALSACYPLGVVGANGKPCEVPLRLIGMRASARPAMLAASPRGGLVAVASESGRIDALQINRVGDVARFRSLFSQQLQLPDLKPGEQLSHLAVTQSGGDSTARIVVGTDQGRLTWIDPHRPDSSGPWVHANDGRGGVSQILVLPGNREFAVVVGKRASLHQSPNGDLSLGLRPVSYFDQTSVQRNQTHRDDVTSVAYDPVHWPRFATTGKDGFLRVYSMDKSNDGGLLTPHTIRVISPTGQGEGDSNGIPLEQVAVSPTMNSKWFVSADVDGTLRAYKGSLTNGHEFDAKPEILIDQTSVAAAPLRQLAFSPEPSDQPLLAAVRADGLPILFRLNAEHRNGGKHFREFPLPFSDVTQVAWVSGSELGLGTQTGEVVVLDLSRPGVPRVVATYTGASGPIDAILPMNQGRQVAISEESANGSTGPGRVFLAPMLPKGNR